MTFGVLCKQLSMLGTVVINVSLHLWPQESLTATNQVEITVDQCSCTIIFDVMLDFRTFEYLFAVLAFCRNGWAVLWMMLCDVNVSAIMLAMRTWIWAFGAVVRLVLLNTQTLKGIFTESAFYFSVETAIHPSTEKILVEVSVELTQFSNPVTPSSLSLSISPFSLVNAINLKPH